MSECNCCCAYLSPPWWVTMGYVPPVGYMPPGRAQGQTPPDSQPTASPPLRVTLPPGSVVVPPPPPAEGQAVAAAPPRGQGTPPGPRTIPAAAGVVRVLGDLATGNIVAALGDAVTLL